ncbi:MAG: HEAT repeat domain-containing protein [Methanotrichaceae archaeon]
MRWRTVRSLGEMGDLGSIRLLFEALKDENPVVRWEAATALGKIGDPRSVGALAKALEDESYKVREKAAQALIRLSGVPEPRKENLDRLMKLLPSKNKNIIDAIVQIGSNADEALASCLDDKLFFVRQESAHALACRVENLIENRPEGIDILDWLVSQNFGPDKIACLYSFRTRVENGLVKRVEYTRFDEISSTILGKKTLKLISPEEIPDLVHSEPRSIENVCLENFVDFDNLERIGRTLVSRSEGKCMAIKLALKESDKAKLLAESQVQEYLDLHRREVGLCSILPKPLAPNDDHYLFKIQDLPQATKAELDLDGDPCAICYIADENYFKYLNDPLLSPEDVAEGLTICASDLALLARQGLIHDSLIPLFHNREQIGTRIDQGTYEWYSMIPGRLDRWVESCQYPNLRLSGIADFEHFSFCPVISAQELRHHTGNHLLSMSFVLGSYFRNRNKFETDAMSAALEEVFEAYYHAFTCSDRSPLDDCIDWDNLASRMTEEMKENKYMIALIRGGPDCKDLKVCSGPHLGLFGGFFPLPELIKAIHITTLFAMLDISPGLS